MIKLKDLLNEDLLLEGRIEDFNKKYEMLQPELRRRIVLNDPSSSKKYIDWVGRIASSEPDIDIEDLLKDVNQFDRYQASFGDIYKLKSYNDLKLALSSRVKSNKEKTREGANMILDDEEFLIVAPTTHESCAYYGNNTKWCIVASEKWWNNYYYKETIIILLDKRDGQKYAITGNCDGVYTVYEKNDNTISYSNMFGDGEYQWPEYVQEAIENYMSSDDPDSRKDKYDAMLIDEFVKNEGTDSIWEKYINNLNSEYNLEYSTSSLNDFKIIAAEYGLDAAKLEELARAFVYEQIISGGDVDDLGYFSKNEYLRQSLNDMGNEPKIKDTLEQIDVDYAHNQRNIDGVLEILQQSIPPQEYTRLYNNGKIDEEIFDAITKYNKMLNSQQQQTFATSKESVQIRNISDIIFVLKRTGHENVAGYLETLIGIKENKTSHIKLKDLLLKETYMGNCVDIGNEKNVPIRNIFSDANELSHVVNPDGDNFLQVTSERFYSVIPIQEVPKKAIKGNLEYYRIMMDSSGNEMSDTQCGIWWIYNVTQDIHYFFQPSMRENKLSEVMYPNMVGIHELSLFYDNASPNTQSEVEELLDIGKNEAAWDIIRNFLRTIGKLTQLEEHKDIRNYFLEEHMFPQEFNRHALGSCMAAAALATDYLLSKGIKNFKIIEGWVSFDGDYEIFNNTPHGNVASHTWIQFDNGKIFDPTKNQWKNWGYDPKDVKYIPNLIHKEYTPEEYQKICRRQD